MQKEGRFINSKGVGGGVHPLIGQTKSGYINTRWYVWKYLVLSPLLLLNSSLFVIPWVICIWVKRAQREENESDWVHWMQQTTRCDWRWRRDMMIRIIHSHSLIKMRISILNWSQVCDLVIRIIAVRCHCKIRPISRLIALCSYSPQDASGEHLSLGRQRLSNGLFAVDSHRCVVLFVHNTLHTWIVGLLLLGLLLLVSVSIGLTIAY